MQPFTAFVALTSTSRSKPAGGGWIMRRSFPLITGIMFAFTAAASAQQPESKRTGARPILDRETEVRLARSAAPPAVSDAATVYVLTASGYAEAERGTSGAACYVSRSWRHSIEPHCFDAEGAATIMRIHMREIELYQQGMTKEQVDRAIADALLGGTLRLPRRSAVSYMMSAGQVLYNDEGRHVGAWRPHLMIYSPYLTNEEIGMTGEPDIRAGMVVDPGEPDANLMIVVPAFIELKTGAAKRP
jgi:hypothetical protein